MLRESVLQMSAAVSSCFFFVFFSLVLPVWGGWHMAQLHEHLSWSDAVQRCRDLRGELFSPESREAVAAELPEVQAAFSYWVGIKRTEDGARWEDMYGNDVSDALKGRWAGGGQNWQEEECVYARGNGVFRQFYANDCSFRPSLVCEFASAPPSAATASEPGNSIIFQRRTHLNVSFEKRFPAYEEGFGEAGGDFWLGLKTLTALTSTPGSAWNLRVNFTLFSTGEEFWAEYSGFTISAARAYRLQFTGWVGGNIEDDYGTHYGMDHFRGRKFSTHDKDQDNARNSCAREYGRGGWWYNDCLSSRLSGTFNARPVDTARHRFEEMQDIFARFEEMQYIFARKNRSLHLCLIMTSHMTVIRASNVSHPSG